MQSKIEIKRQIRELKERMSSTKKILGTTTRKELHKNRFKHQQDKLADLYAKLRSPDDGWILTIKGRPVSSKNSKQIFYNKKTNRPFITSAKNVKDWFVEAIEQLKNQWDGKDPISNEIKCDMKVYLAKGQWMDTVNAAQAPLDAMERAGVIVNDSRIKTITISMARDWDCPRYEIKLRGV